MIYQKDLNTGLPPVREVDGSCNVVLAMWHPNMYHKDGSNSYLPAWSVVNTIYYNKYPNNYIGWIDLEDINTENYSASL